jgi:threonine synthase
MAAAITKATELGLRRFVVPTAGNAGVAAAAYVQAAGGEIDVFMPDDTDELFFAAAQSYGARLHRVAGLISHCGQEAQKLVGEGAFDLSTLKEPYRLEGKKTMGYELWEQCDGRLPDVIIYPTGGGTGLIGLWKAFAELQAARLLQGPKPRMVAVQMAGCAPMVRAHHRAAEHAEPWRDARTDVLGLRVPGAVGDFLILQALRESGGTALSVGEEEAFQCVADLHQATGLAVAPEGGAVFAALLRLIAAGRVQPDEHIVVLITGSADLYDGILQRHGIRVTGDR